IVVDYVAVLGDGSPQIPPANTPKGPLGPRGALRFPGAGAGGRASFKEESRWANDHEMLEGIMSDEFDGLDATEKAGIEAALNRCRRVAAQIASELRNKRHEHFVDKLSLADIHASLERAAGVLEQKCLDDRFDNTSTPTVTSSQVQSRRRA